jgi:ferredoxin-NADP reductase
MTVRVFACRLEAEGVFSLDLRPHAPATLPPFTAGAHIDVLLPDGQERSYSLLNAPGQTSVYSIAVKRQAESRGGSAYMCDVVRVGDILQVKPPSNNFPLAETAPSTLLIAGGIGITPFLSMMHRLDQIGRPWKLFYAAATAGNAAFGEAVAAFEARQPGRVTRHFDDAPGAQPIDLGKIIAAAPAGTHVYCCGPTPMMKAFERAAAVLPPAQVHMEYFSATEDAAEGGFEVLLAKSGRTVRIPRNKTILETLLLEGMDLPRSCMEGVCGTCETVVLDGIPDHRDQVLSPRERRSNTKMMICRSGSIGPRLVLDL